MNVLLPSLRYLYSRLPKTYYPEPGQLQHVTCSLGYTDDLADEGKIAAVVAVARAGWPRWRTA